MGGGQPNIFLLHVLISHFIRDVVELYGRGFNVVLNSAECKPQAF
jgi:hypothetical protein